MTNYSDISVALKAVIDGVTGIGTSFTRPRFFVKITQKAKTFLSAGVFHTWFVNRPSAEPPDVMTSGRINENWNWEAIGYYAINDANDSWTTFQDLIDEVVDALNHNDNANLLDNVCLIRGSYVVEFIEVEFMGVLCHKVTLVIPIKIMKTLR